MKNGLLKLVGTTIFGKLLRLVLLAIPILIQSSCFIIKPVSIKGIEHFEMKSGGDKTEIRFDLLLQNPNGFSLQVKEFNCALQLSDSILGSLYTLKDVRITKKEFMRLPLSYYPEIANFSQMLMSIDSLSKKGVKVKGLEIKGEMRLHKFIFTRKIKWSESIRQ